MENKFNFVSVETIFSKIHRDLRGIDIEESDVIEWVGEALGFMRVAGIDEEAVAFVEVVDNKCELPVGLKSILQVARNNSWVAPTDELSPETVLASLVCDEPNDGILLDPDSQLPDDTLVAYYRPYYDLQFEYEGWTGSPYYREHYTPVRLANNTFFNTLVTPTLDEEQLALYRGVLDEYTIIGAFPNNSLLFGFNTGYVAIAYIRAAVDSVTGYPLIPDDVTFITAITYYIKWKMAERMRWNGVDGALQESRDAEEKWLKYMRQAINRVKMPSTIDEYQNIMEQSLHLIPRTRYYYGFFGKLGREEQRRFNNPDGRRRFTYNRYNYGFQQ